MKENIYNQLTFNRLTRAQYNTLASNNQINPYELYFIIDEDSYALSNNTYTKSEVDALIQGINISNYYNKSAVDSLISDFATESYVNTAVTDMATETYVDGKISDLVNGAGSALDTLKELSDALGNDANFATTVANQIALKANASTTYTKTEVDNALSAKADASTTYTKTEVDNLIPPAQTFKTINGQTITGSGNITISAGSELTMNSSRPDAVTLASVNVIKDASDAIVGIGTNPGQGYIWFENEVESDFNEGYCVASFTVTNPNATYKLTVTNNGQLDNSVEFFFNIDTDIRDDRGIYLPANRIATKTATELHTTPYVYSITNLTAGTHYIYAAVLGEDDQDAGFDIVATLTQDRVELTNIEKEGIIYDITGGSNSIDPTDYYVGSLKVSASSTNTASPRFGSILPASTNTYALGTNTYIWNTTYANTYNIGNGVNYYINGATSKLNALQLSNSLILNNGLLKYGTYNLQLPSKSGTLATTSDIPDNYYTKTEIDAMIGSVNTVLASLVEVSE